MRLIILSRYIDYQYILAKNDFSLFFVILLNLRNKSVYIMFRKMSLGIDNCKWMSHICCRRLIRKVPNEKKALVMFYSWIPIIEKER